MKLSFLRLDTVIDITSSAISTLQIENRTVFTRVVRSLMSEKGEEAIEPYQLIDECDKSVNPKKSLFIIDSLPNIPLNDRSLLTNLYRSLNSRFLEDSSSNGYMSYLEDRMGEVFAKTTGISQESWGNYDFDLEWNVETFLKAFCFVPIAEEGSTLIENSIAFFELLADINFSVPVIFINVKSFFDQNDLEILFEQAIFCGIKLLLLESWIDENNYDNERKTIIDQYLLVS